jgi:predicted metalloprotease with PDZ domain
VTILYTVVGHDAETHRVSLRIELPASPGGHTELVLPTWVPGAYEVRESSREVGPMTAKRSSGGAALDVERVSKNRWRVAAPAGEPLELEYTVYARELLDDGIEANAEHLFLSAARCFPCVEGRRKEPVELLVHLAPGTTAHAELPRVSEHPVRFRAADYDELLDTPVDIGHPRVIEFRPHGIPHRMLICGEPGNFDAHRIEQDLERIVSATIAYFEGSPLTSYTFFTHLADQRRSGLEHRASTSLIANRLMFQPREAYEEFLLLCAHEYFHLYNVKRIKPRVLIDPPLDTEVYSRLLWLMEGTTDYVAAMLLRRAGLEPPARTREKMAERVCAYRQIPGRLVRSLEEASRLSWVDLYRPYEESRNQSVSYYTKGCLVSWCFDLEILSRSGGRASLQTVMRHLWKEYGQTGRGIGEEELPAIFRTATGLDLEELFERYVRGTGEIDFARTAHLAGLGCEPVPRPESVDKPVPGYLGAEVALERGEVRVRVVLDGTPGRRAGLTPGDEIVAFDGIRVTAADYTDRLTRLPPGTDVELTLFRRGVLRRLTVTMGTPPPEKYRIEPLPEASPLEKQVYEAWLGAPWEPPKSPVPATAR